MPHVLGARAASVSSGALPGTSSSSLFGCHRRPVATLAGAPRALARSHVLRAHHSRFEIWFATSDLDYAKLYCIDHHPTPRRVPVGQVCGSSVRQRMLQRWSCRRRRRLRPETTKGHLVFPGGPHAVNALVERGLAGGDPQDGRTFVIKTDAKRIESLKSCRTHGQLLPGTRGARGGG